MHTQKEITEDLQEDIQYELNQMKKIINEIEFVKSYTNCLEKLPRLKRLQKGLEQRVHMIDQELWAAQDRLNKMNK